MSDNASHEPIRGITLASGVAAGPALQFDEDPHILEPMKIPIDESVDAALARLEDGLERTRNQLRELMDNGATRYEDVVELVFRAHLLMLDDETFSGEIRRLVGEGTQPERAVTDTIEALATSFSRNHHERTAEKADDVRDLGYRLLGNLASPSDTGQRAFVSGRIVLLTHVFPSELLRLAIDGAAGIVLIDVTLTSHLSILSRSLGIPVLSTTMNAAREITDDTRVLLDGNRGVIVPFTDVEVDSGDKRGGTAEADGRTGKTSTSDTPGSEKETAGTAVSLLASVNILADAYGARNHADGIGLYRSEFPFIIRGGMLDEAVQTRIYRHIVSQFSGKPVTLRTADIGGDKIFPDIAPEDNPFLGVRGVRFSLANRDMFRTQLRAMLRAGAGEDLGIMLPMVSTVEEVLEARAELERCLEELAEGDADYNTAPRLGAMIEIPSAAVIAREIAAHTDFLSVGMNDLVMYMLAVDRTNAKLSDLYRTRHPVIARTVARIVKHGREAGVPVTICGEAAGDPLLLPFYVGIGVSALSISSQKLRETRWHLERVDQEWSEHIARKMIAVTTMEDMEQILETVGERMNVADVSSENRLRSTSTMRSTP